MGFRFPLTLEGTNVFRGNIGGGVSLLQSHLNSFGHTLFEDNIAARGGGIELRDSSVVSFILYSTWLCLLSSYCADIYSETMSACK